MTEKKFCEKDRCYKVLTVSYAVGVKEKLHREGNGFSRNLNWRVNWKGKCQNCCFFCQPISIRKTQVNVIPIHMIQLSNWYYLYSHNTVLCSFSSSSCLSVRARIIDLSKTKNMLWTYSTGIYYIWSVMVCIKNTFLSYILN